METFFETSSSWRLVYPAAAVGVLVVRGALNPEGHPALEQRRSELESRLRARFAGQDRAAINALPVMQAYEAYYKKFKKTYHVALQLESVVFKGKALPSVAALVESMFMAELENMLLTAGHDLDTLDLPARVNVSNGDEEYTLMRGEQATLKVADMFIADRKGIISSIIYGPDQRTRITPTTTAAMYTVYAPPGIPSSLVQAHLECLRDNVLLGSPSAQVELLRVYQGKD
jgi:DNA/RNA-binding domain of Phe-tRNA-synthetase-like protein